jgi:transposase
MVCQSVSMVLGATARPGPLLPQDTGGVPRVEDRRAISGIIRRLREGCPRGAVPPDYGPHTTVFNDWNRWSLRALWQRIPRRARLLR